MRLTSIEVLEAHGFELNDTDMGPGKTAELTALKGCIAEAIELLPEMYREVYLRREILEERANDVAVALGISLPAVKSRLHRARAQMRESLDSGLGCLSLTDPDS
jgi:DNA-directed RNA polymerase specialized sigma24 family protein